MDTRASRGRRLLAGLLALLGLLLTGAFVVYAWVYALWPAKDELNAGMSSAEWYGLALGRLVPDLLVALVVGAVLYWANRRLLGHGTPADRRMAWVLALVPAAVVLAVGVVAATV